MKQKNCFRGLLRPVREADAKEEKNAKRKDTLPAGRDHLYAGEYIMAGLLVLLCIVSLILKMLRFI